MRKYQLLTALALVLSTAPTLHSQIIGNQKNGQSSPTEVKASELGAGGFSGNVNLFTGTYNASYPLGTVSTPSGLSYAQTLSYGSTFTSGDNLPHVSGIPYGEGWNLDIPSISVSSEDYNKFTLKDEQRLRNGNPTLTQPYAYTKLFSFKEATEEGGVYWFSPMLNIPGVASGRLVYKYYRGNHHYFVLHTFDRYIEAIFDGGQWEVVLDDGTRYELIPVMVSYRTPSNQRVTKSNFQGENECNEDSSNGALKYLTLPKQEVLTWYCRKITNRNIIGAIHFKYETFGAFDFNKIFTTQNALWDAISELFGIGNSLGINRKPDVGYRDIFLKEIDSGYEKLVLDYGSIPTDNGYNMLDPNDNKLERVDSLYAKKVVYSAKTTGGEYEGFNDWYRYKHAKSDGVNGWPSGRNPYKDISGLGGSTYHREPLTNSETAFEHGYLESPRLENATDFVAGDLYEVRTWIQSCEQLTASEGPFFDINLATGNTNGYTLPINPAIDAECYENSTGESVFTTFNQAIKWFMNGNQNANGYAQDLNTSNYFVMPNLPSDYNGFHIQVGPANSDTRFDMPPAQITSGLPNEIPFTCRSYYGVGYGVNNDPEYCDTYPNSGDCSGWLRSGDNIPNNFGIGLPWYMLTHFYSNPEWVGNFCYCPDDINGPNYEGFWWNYSTSGLSYPNQPTKATENISLEEVELVRYSKTPYMLKSAKKQIFNGGTALPNGDQDMWHTVAHHEFSYEITTKERYGSYLDGANQMHYEIEDFRNIVLLEKITQLPYDNAGIGNNIPLVTTFGYKDVSNQLAAPQALFEVPNYSNPDVPLNGVNSPNLNSEYPALNSITDPLGKVTKINYMPLGEGSYFLKKFNYILRPWESLGLGGGGPCPPTNIVRQAPSFAFQVNMVVDNVSVNDRNGPKCWSYTFDTNNLFKRDDRPYFDEHFEIDKQFNYKAGFGTAAVKGPSESCGGNGPTIYYVHDQSDLFWGKLVSVSSKDENGKLVSESDYSYKAVVAFESPAHRVSQQVHSGHFDYKEYWWEEDGRPLLSDYNNDFTLYNSAIHTFMNNTGIISDSIYLGYQNDTIILQPIAPSWSCPNNPGETCGCGNYDDLGPAQQDSCDVFWNEYYQWLVNRPSGWFSPYATDYSPNYFYESRYDELIEEHDPTYAYSFFIKKIGESTTNYDSSCEGGEGSSGMTTSVAYEYFDADYSGKPSDQSGYDQMGIPNQLFWEPSWQLYKKTTTAGEYQTIEEYFYLYDLLNDFDYLWYADFQVKANAGFEMLRTLWNFKNKRDLVFEKRVTRVAPGGANMRSTYFTYSMDWEDTESLDTIINLIDPLINEPCDSLIGGGGGNGGGGFGGWGNGGDPGIASTPPAVFHKNLNTEPDLPADFCENLHELPFHVWSTPCRDNPNNPNGGPWYNNYIPNGDTTVQIANYFLAGKIHLKSVVEQVEPPGENDPGNSLLDHTSGFETPTFPYPTLTVQTIDERNKLSLVVSETDEKDLHTRYTYGQGYRIDYLDCSYNPPALRSMFLTNFVGLPISVTVGDELPNALTTEYSYRLHDNNIDTITDPNGMELSYFYDGFGRMAEARRNGDLIQSVLYSNANDGSGFAGSAALNHVDVFNYVEKGIGWGSTGYIDPLGRKVATRNYSGSSEVLVEDNIFDIYDRAEMQIKRHTGDGPTVNKSFTCNDLNFEYGAAPRVRALKSAKYTLCPDDPDLHYVKNGYCIATRQTVLDELSAAGKVEGLSFISGLAYQRTETTDEDGKTVVIFTDNGGNTAATITNNGTIATVFLYNEFGNVKTVSNAKEQPSYYNFNFLGQLKNKNTPDEGIHDYAYNQSGQLICYRDANQDVRVHGYDEFGRMTVQAKATGHFGMLDPGKDGNPWVHDRTYGFLEDAIAGATKEKEWFYEEPDPNVPLVAELQAEMGDITFSKGRLVHSNSYGLDGFLHEKKFLSYNADGFLKWEAVQFDGSIYAPGGPVAVKIDYPEYNLQGSYKVQNAYTMNLTPINELAQHYFHYDSWNRIQRVKYAMDLLEEDGFMAAEYKYDDVLGVVLEKALFNHEQMGESVCKDLPVDTVRFAFDDRERLSSISSKLYGHSLFYDGLTLNGADDNYNGNINATIAAYGFDPEYVVNVPDNFYLPTTYGYKYDNLNRLVEADATTGIFDPYNSNVQYIGDPNYLGDAAYEYDKIGNLKELVRGHVYEMSPDNFEFGKTTYNYGYQAGNNRLNILVGSGLKSPDCTGSTIYSFSHDDNGNMLTNTKRGVGGVVYGRANLPFFVNAGSPCDFPEQTGGPATYLYDINDARMFKNSSGEEGILQEYYVRDAAGHELAVFDHKEQKFAVRYVYGNERVAKISEDPGPPSGGSGGGSSGCRPKPACDPSMLVAQQAYIQGLNYVTDPFSISYDTKLFRIRLCNGFEPHLLASEIGGLPGNYIILQQIELTSPIQEFTVWQASGISILTLSSVLSLREGNDQFLLNGYSSCDEFACPAQFTACGEGDSEAQRQAISDLRTEYMNILPGDVELPARIIRIRLCDATEMYVLQEMLPDIPGNYTILQQVEVTSPNQTFEVTVNGVGPSTKNFADVLDLLFSSLEVELDGYLPCENGQPCTAALPNCTEEMNYDQLASIQAMVQLFANASSVSYSYPTKIYRIRLCSGDEFHLVREELYAVPGNFLFLQELTVLSPTEQFPMEVEGGSGTYDIMGDMQAFIDHRNGNSGTPLYAINGYAPCGDLSPCHPSGEFGCSAQQTAEQHAAIVELQNIIANTNPLNVAFPNTLYKVQLCNGTSMYLLSEEISSVDIGPHAIIQVIPLVSLNETFQVVVDNIGPAQTFSVYDILAYRVDHDILVIGYGCSVMDFPDGNANGNYEISGENFQYQIVDNSNQVIITFDKVIKLDGIEILRESQSITQTANFWMAPRAYKLSPNGYISEIFISTLNPTQSFPIYFRPSDVQVHYPGLVANNLGILSDLEKFGATIAENEKYADALKKVIDYAIRLNGPGPAQNTVEVLANVPGGFEIMMKFQVLHNPTGYYANCDMLSFYISCSNDGVTENCDAKLGSLKESNTWTISYDPCGLIYVTFLERYIYQNTDFDWHEIILSLPPPDISSSSSYSSITCTDITTTETYCGPPIAIFENCQYITCGGFEVNLPELPQECCEGTTPSTPGGDGGIGTTPPHVPSGSTPDPPSLPTDMLNKTAANTTYPNRLNLVQLENGWHLYALNEELTLTPDDCFEVDGSIDVESDSTPLLLTLKLQDQWVRAGNVTLQDVLDFRAQGIPMMVEAGDPNSPQMGMEPLPAGVRVPEFAFFIYDHLGNTRVLYSNDLIECNEDSTKYILEHVLDYYPFGRTLRDYVWKRDRFQTTYHERDLESGLDYRGARFYDGDIGRFLSVDPLAIDYAEWSTYNYVLGNPVILVDPDGRSSESTHLDEDGNFIASFDDGDENVYEHANGTSMTDIQAFNYYTSGNTGANVTHGGGTQIAGSEISVTATKSGFLVHANGNYTLPEGETPFQVSETVWIGGGNVVGGAIGNLEITAVKDVPVGFDGTLTTGNSTEIIGTMGSSYELMGKTKGRIVLDQRVTGSNLEEMFSGVGFVTTKSASYAGKYTGISAFSNRSLANKIFHADTFGTSISFGGSGSRSVVKFEKK